MFNDTAVINSTSAKNIAGCASQDQLSAVDHNHHATDDPRRIGRNRIARQRPMGKLLPPPVEPIPSQDAILATVRIFPLTVGCDPDDRAYCERQKPVVVELRKALVKKCCHKN